jgi:hypothetical protein
MASSSCGNSAARTLAVTVNNLPNQPGTISGATAVNAGGGTQTYSITAVSGATSYTWILPSGWTGSSTSTSISATPGSSASSGNISVTANNSCGSSTARSLAVTINSAPAQPGAISGTTSICAGSGVQTYSITAVSGATSYTWSLPSGWSGSSASTSISATPGSSAQSGNISVTANNSSGSSAARTLAITVNSVPNQPGTISGTTAVNAGGGTQTYSITAVSGATSYTWTLPSGWSGSSTSTSISATPGSSAQSGNISVTANNSCGSSTARTYVVTVSAPCNGVAPLLTTYWAQGAPFNNLVNSKLHQYYPAGLSYDYPTGCVATAMAQIMNYWEHPIQRTKRIPDYETGSLNISVPAIIGTTTYDWANMKNTTAEYTTPAQKNAVAELMYECGVAVHMNYKPGGSGAYVLENSTNYTSFAVLPTYFGYDKSIKSQWRGNLNSEWDDLLISDLNAGRPVLYIGYDPDGGHAFVCDGYSCNTDAYGKRYFHFNWGWGEAYQKNSNNANNGYFVSSALNIGGYAFNNSQGIVYNIKPNSAAYVDPTNADGTSTFAISSNALPGGYIIPEGTAIVYIGENQPLAFAANSGYEIDQVFIDGTFDATAKANGYYIFQNVMVNHSIIVTFKASPTGIEDIRSQDISIYPNPVTNDLFIKSGLPVKRIEIYSLTGSLIKIENNFNEKMSLAALPKGIYLLKVYTDKEVVVSKIVKE